MAFTGTSVEILALIFLIVASIKTVVILIKPSAWLNGVVKKVWAKPRLMMIISLILSVVVLYYLIQSVTIVEIFAVILFLSLLAAVGISVYYKEMISLAQKLMKDRTIIKKSWLYIIIWIALIIWGFYALFV